MAKFHGKIGWSTTVEQTPGVYKEFIFVKSYYGDVLHERIDYKSDEKINPDMIMSNRISVFMDSILSENLANIRFVEFMGSRWNVSAIEVKYPRLLISMKGLYNGPEE